MTRFEKGTIVISVDDGRWDAYRLFKEILQPYHLAATFNIVTDWVTDGDELPRSSISCAELAEMIRSPLVEIAGHGHRHCNDEEDIIKGKERLCRWLRTTERIGFASPGSRMKLDFVNDNAQKLADIGLLYVRSVDETVGKDARHTSLIETAEKNACSEYVTQMIPRISYGYDGMFVNSAVVFSDTEVEDIKRLTEIAMGERACLVLMFHSVKKEGEAAYEDMYSYDFEKFKELAVYWNILEREGKLAVMTNKEAYRKGFVGG